MRGRNRSLCSAVIAMIGAFIAAATSVSHAETPTITNFQGILNNSSGMTQTFSVAFSIYGVPAGGTAVWTENQIVTVDPNGLFNVMLGTNTPLTDAVFSSPTCYLGTTVSPDGEMMPRTRIVTAAYSFRTSTVDGATGGSISGPVNITGNVNIGGTLTKSAGSFKIDHPLDPANKYLSHSFVESPDMMNIYNGTVMTDAKGYASVTMPQWFEALNKDFRYQLTVIGQFAQAIVSDEIKGNQFSIRTDKPNVKVSWQVTGIRQDAYANANRIPVEETKSIAEQGIYRNPELSSQPEEKQIEWARRPEVMQQMKAEREKALLR